MATIEIQDLGASAIASSLAWFEARLSDRRIRLDVQCELRRGLNALQQLATKAQAQVIERLPPREALRQVIQTTSTDTLTKVLHQGERAGLGEFERHWRALKAGNPLVTGPSDGHSQDRTRTWELVLASLCATFCQAVHDEEPDVVAVRANRRIGIAAKMLFTETKSAFCSRIEEGIDQIERAAVDAGIVAINLTDVYPHEEQFTAFHSMRYRHPGTLLYSVDQWVCDFLSSYGPSEGEWRKLFEKRAKLMAIAFLLPTVVTYRKWHFPTPMPMYRWSAFYVTEREPEAEDFLTEVQRAYERARAFKDQPAEPHI